MALILTLFLISHSVNAMNYTGSNPLVSLVEYKLEELFVDYAVDVGKWLEQLNDRNFKNSETARLLRYENMKAKFSVHDKEGRSMKMSMVMMPLVFHLGVTSTWIMLTAIMAAKSVAIDILLVIFKVASSSAKIASYFTAWKGHHRAWSPHDHHTGAHHVDSQSYSPAWSPPLEEYRTIPHEADSKEIPVLNH